MKIIVDDLPRCKEECIFSSPLYGTSERFCILSRKVCNLHEGFNETDCNGARCLAEQTEPQYDFGEYADRLWEIAYERGKREALEQTELSCDTCKLKDTTEWCKRQEVCRAYQPKTENSSEIPNNCEPQTETQIKTQNSNLTFEKRKCIDCKFLTYMFGKTWCNIKCDNPHDKVCDRWQANEPQTEEWYTFQDEQEYNARHGKE